jgi:tetratricopeptide (TPR) repeat protein
VERIAPGATRSGSAPAPEANVATPRSRRVWPLALTASTLVLLAWLSRPYADGLRITLEIVDARSGFQRWSRTYDGARVIRSLVDTGPDFVRKPGSVTPLTYYLQGRQAVEEATRERLLDAVARYERAIELDPQYVDAHVALAHAYERLWHQDRPGAGWLDRGEIAVLRALELDPHHADAFATHATLLRARRQWTSAETAYRRAIELGASGYSYSRYASMLCMLGRVEEAVPLVDRSLELAPLDSEAPTHGRTRPPLPRQSAPGHRTPAACARTPPEGCRAPPAAGWRVGREWSDRRSP